MVSEYRARPLALIHITRVLMTSISHHQNDKLPGVQSHGWSTKWWKVRDLVVESHPLRSVLQVPVFSLGSVDLLEN